MRNYTQISTLSPAPTVPSYPHYSTCPFCGDQLYLSRRHYFCRNTITCSYTVPAQHHAETLALTELASSLEAPKTHADLDAESRDYDELQAAYDRVTGQLDLAFSARRRNYDKIEALSQQQASLSSQLMQEAM